MHQRHKDARPSGACHRARVGTGAAVTAILCVLALSRAAESLPASSIFELESEGATLTLAIDPRTPETVYAGTYRGGVFKSVDGGGRWHGVNAGLPADAVVPALAIDPFDPSRLYAAVLDAGIFRSIDGSVAWRPVIQGLSAKRVWTLAIDPSRAETLYAGTIGDGVFKSLDGGEAWSSASVGLPSESSILSLAVDATDPSRLYAGTFRQGMFSSRDGGANWSAIEPLANASRIWALEIDPFEPEVLYAATGNAVVAKRADHGRRWLAGGPRLPFATDIMTLAIDPIDRLTVYAGTNGGGVLKSTDGGLTWSAANRGLSDPFILALAIDPTDPMVVYAAAGGLEGGVFKSIDGGESWAPAGHGIAAHSIDLSLADLPSRGADPGPAADLLQHGRNPIEGEYDRTTSPSDPAPTAETSPLAAGSTSLVINELDYHGADGDSAEFVEIKNAGDQPVEMAEYAIRTYYHMFSSQPVFVRHQLPSWTLQPGDYFVMCREGNTADYCDAHAGGSVELLRDFEAAAVGLVHSPSGQAADDTVVDSVCYLAFSNGGGVPGGLAGGDWTETTCIQTPESSDEVGFSRVPDGDDRNDNDRDFRSACLTPGEPNVASERSCVTGGEPLGKLLINEADPNQADHPDLAEFVEIKNVGSNPVSLADYNLRHLSYNWWSLLLELNLDLPDATLQPGDYFVLCRDAAHVQNCDSETLFRLNDGNGVLAIVHNPSDAPESEILVDSFVYGSFYELGMPDGPRGEPWIEGELEEATDGTSAIHAPPDTGYSRVCDGADTQSNLSDYRLVAISPGEPNAWGDEPGQPCSNNGTCFGSPGAVTCDCDRDWFGSQCNLPPGEVIPMGSLSCPASDPTCTLSSMLWRGGTGIRTGTACPDLFSEARQDVEIEAVVYGPEDLAARPSGSTPFAVFVPGADQHYERYQPLLEQAAAAGIVIAVADRLPSPNDAPADEVSAIQRCYVRHLRSHWLHADKLSEDLALMGHSRGGKASLLSATRLPETAGGLRAKTIVAFAPRTNSVGVSVPELEAQDTDFVLLLQGSRDEDTGAATIRFFDFIGDSQDKTLVNVHGMSHNQIGGGSFSFGLATLDDATATAVSRVYMNAALRWQLLGEESLRSIVSGAATSPVIDNATTTTGDPVTVTLDFYDEVASRGSRVVDRFDRIAGVLGHPPDAVLSATDFSIARVERPFGAFAASLQGAANSLHLAWPAGSSPVLRYDFDDPVSWARLRTLMLRSTNVLSPGAPDQVGGCMRQLPAATELTIRVGGPDGVMDVQGSDYGSIGIPDQFNPNFDDACLIAAGCSLGNVSCLAQYGASSIRIPTSEFCSASRSLHSIELLELHFDGQQPGELWLDDILIAGDPRDPADYTACDPICGNGLEEAGEECDDGNLANTDLCVNSCRFARCGDGYIWDGSEECDDGNTLGSDGCSSTCEVEPGDEDCPGDEPGCAGAPCREIPSSAGIAAYYQNGRYCDAPDLICRESSGGEWRCSPCEAGGPGFGCPCDGDCTLFSDPRPLECVGYFDGERTAQYPISSPVAGACLPPGGVGGFCPETCEAQARICSSLLGSEPARCVAEECSSFCEDNGLTCDRDLGGSGQCVQPCIEGSCPGTLLCTTWGECWG